MMPDLSLWQFCLRQRIWNGATRTICSRVITFICKENYENMWINSKSRDEIESKYKINPHIFYRWSVASSYVDYIAQKLLVNKDDLTGFLERKNFDINHTYNPDRASRYKWFFDTVKTGTFSDEKSKDKKIPGIFNSIVSRNTSVDHNGRIYVRSDTGVRVFADFRDNLIVDKDDPSVNTHGNRFRYRRGIVRGLSYMGSENSEDAITWNVFRTLIKSPVSEWFSHIFPVNMTGEEYENTEFSFWKEFIPPPSRPVKEGKTQVDFTVETPDKLIFLEVKYKSDISPGTRYDAERDQIIRNVDTGTWAACEKGKNFYFILLISRDCNLSADKFNLYKKKPERMEEKIGFYRDDIKDYSSVAGHMHLLYWEDLYRILQNKGFAEKTGLDLKELLDFLKDKF